MASITYSVKKTVSSNAQMSDITCNYCKEKGIWSRTAKNLRRKRKKDAQQGKPTQKKVYLKGGTCGKTNHPEERCWQGAGAHLKPKRTRPKDSSDNNPDSKALKPTTSQHHLVPNLLQAKTVQTTSFATTPI